MLTVWGRRSSSNVQKVMWLVGELDLEHQHIPAGGDFGGLDSAGFLAMNPHGRVPVIDDDGTVVWESHACLRYLAARHAAGSWWDPDPARRAQVDGWMDWAHTRLQPDFLVGVFWGYFRTPPAQRDRPRIHAMLEECARHMQTLQRQLGDREFLLGNRIGLADIAVGAHLHRYFNLDIDRPAVPAVEAWYRRLQRRRAYREHVMIDFEDLRGRLDY